MKEVLFNKYVIIRMKMKGKRYRSPIFCSLNRFSKANLTIKHPIMKSPKL